MAAETQSILREFDAADALLGSPDQSHDVEMVDSDADLLSHVILAIDFGTTFSSVAYARITNAMCERGLQLADVKCVEHYPDDRPKTEGKYHEYRQDVPTELWYPPNYSSRAHKAEDPATNLQGTPHAKATLTDAWLKSTSSIWQFPGDGNSAGDSSTIDDEDEVEDEAEGEVGELSLLSTSKQPMLGKTNRLYWGFEVQKQLRRMDVQKDYNRRITRFKLMLDEESERTQDIREQVSTTLKALKKSKSIHNQTDVISSYLLELLSHTKNEFSQWHDFSNQTPIEFVLSVPAIWPAKACREMQAALVKAAYKSGLQNQSNNSLSNLFIISEPEGAAACVLKENHSQISVSI